MLDSGRISANQACYNVLNCNRHYVASGPMFNKSRKSIQTDGIEVYSQYSRSIGLAPGLTCPGICNAPLPTQGLHNP